MLKKTEMFGIYTSVWHYDSIDLDKAVRLGSLYFDIDSEDEATSLSEAQILYSYLEKIVPSQSLLVYFTGKKGFHIECEAITLGISPSNALPNIYRYIANKLKAELNLSNIDFSVYDQRRMWRYPGTVHQDTGLYKNLLTKDILFSNMSVIKEFCSTPKDNTVPEPLFSLAANQWYLNFTHNMEIDKERSKDFLEYFNKHGSKSFKELSEVKKKFTKKELLRNCPAIKRHIEEAKRTKTLSHETRLFLCSILTYSEDSIQFLYEILSLCDDFNYEKSTSHINDWIKRRQLGIGGRPYTCERANIAGVGCGDCNLEKKKKWITIGDRYIEGSEESMPSPIRFAYKNEKEDTNVR